MSFPLHVKVAQAIGWKDLHDQGGGFWLGTDLNGTHEQEVPNFPRSWCWSGPVIEKYKLTIDPSGGTPEHPEWDVWSGEHGIESTASTPLVAVSHVIVKLSEEGKL